MIRTDVGVGVVALLVGGYFAYKSTQLPLFQNGIPGPGLYPLVVASGLVLCGVLLVIASFVKHYRSRDATATAGARHADGSDFVEILEETAETADPMEKTSAAGVGRATLVWIILLVSVILLEVIGFYLAMALLFALLLLGVERRPTVGSFAVILLIPAVGYLLFEVLLGLSLPGFLDF